MNFLKSVICGSFFLSGTLLFADLQLTENGKTAYKIVLPAKASDNLKYAAHELKIHLDQASGAKFSVVETGASGDDRQIILQELDPKLKTGEFQIRTEGKNLLLSGGGESGIHHAVHDFLESDCGYIWYDPRGGMKIPDLKNFKLPEINRKKKYYFALRSMSPDWFFYRPIAHYFLYRSGMNEKIRHFSLPGMKGKAPVIKFGVNDIRRASPASHTFFDYIPDVPGKSRIAAFKKKGYFKDHPDYFSMSKAGKRFVRQLCFSNPELRAEFKKNFYEHIRSAPDMNIFSVTAYDFPGEICCCKECRASIKKYKTAGAPVFLFVKELGEALEKDFPYVRIWTYAYRKEQTECPPIGLKLPDNVIVNFCPIDDDMSKTIASAVNAETYQHLKDWTKCCSNVWMGFYTNPYTFSTMMASPIGNVYRVAKDIVLSKKAGANGFGADHCPGTASMTGFNELQAYLMARLLRDPDLDIEPLVLDFMKFEYGPAAGLMKKYLDELEKTTAETNSFISWSSKIGAFAQFFKSRDVVRWQGYFDEMEKLTSGDPALNFNVRRVRAPLDLATLNFYRRIKKEVPDYGMDVKSLADRILKTYHESTDAFYPEQIAQIKNHKNNHKKNMENLVRNLSIQMSAEGKELPKEIFGKFDPALVYEFFPQSMAKTTQIKDPQAAWGHAMINKGPVQGCPVQVLEYEPVQGIWDIFAKIEAPKAGSEGKYAFYNVGKTLITPNYQLRFLFPGYKNLFMINPGEVWLPGSDDTVYIYISLKFTGPKYYPGSKEENSIACDRIVLVRKTPGNINEKKEK